MKRKKLLIISHTEHFQNADGRIVGWGATVNEVNFLANYWEDVVHIGCFYEKPPPKVLCLIHNQIFGLFRFLLLEEHRFLIKSEFFLKSLK